MQEFVCDKIKLRSKHNFELNVITNIDETHLYLNMPLQWLYKRLDQRKLI